MNRVKIISFVFSFLLVIASSTSVFAVEDAKIAHSEVLPEWVYLGNENIPSMHNPNGIDVVYGFDKASIRTRKSKKHDGDLQCMVVRIVKAKNEIELVKTSIAKNNASYTEAQKVVFFLDGTLKYAEKLDDNLRQPLADDSPLRYVRQVCESGSKLETDSLTMPRLPEGANHYQVKTPKKGFEDWTCILDDGATGLDKNDTAKLSVVTYAFNTDERIYYKGISYCERADAPKYYNSLGGISQRFTYEGKLLPEEEMRFAVIKDNPKDCFISAVEADGTAQWYYETYKLKK